MSKSGGVGIARKLQEFPALWALLDGGSWENIDVPVHRATRLEFDSVIGGRNLCVYGSMRGIPALARSPLIIPRWAQMGEIVRYTMQGENERQLDNLQCVFVKEASLDHRWQIVVYTEPRITWRAFMTKYADK